METLKGKVVVVIGASSGIGAALSEYFAEKGAYVNMCARREEKLAENTSKWNQAGCVVTYYKCDATVAEEVAKVAKQVVEKYEKIDVWVNCARQNKAIGKVWELDPASMWEEVTIDLKSCINGTHAALQSMVKEDSGVIVNFCGGGTAKPHIYAAAYSTAKTAIARFVESTYAELKLDGSNVKQEMHICQTLKKQ